MKIMEWYRKIMKDIGRPWKTSIDMKKRMKCEKLKHVKATASPKKTPKQCLYVFIEWKHMGNWTTQTGFIKASGHSIPFYTLLARYEWGAISLPRARAFWSTLRSTSSTGKGHWHGTSMLFNTLPKDQTNRFIKWTSGKTWPSVHKTYYRDIHFIVKTCQHMYKYIKQVKATDNNTITIQ